MACTARRASGGGSASSEHSHPRGCGVRGSGRGGRGYQVVRRRIAHGIPPCVDPPSVLDCALDAVACGVRQVDTLDQRHGLLQQRAESSEEEGHSHADDHIEENVACAE
eukprot:scaffold72682_cov30-Tisochrysis_lutea.AAC.6